MKRETFLQATLSFVLFIFSIIVFKLLKIDMNFIVTFILAIFTLSISIFFFIESNKIMVTIKERVIEIQKDIEYFKVNEEKVKGLNIQGFLDYVDKKKRVKRW
ncbi:hypothetical protein CMI41_03750 [Candidatus Pacearchaeota archaeon]|nr:hypothetical protein [Candidatus Pacearchaeota archaeon]|tara:strand:- start:5035 stop:5343 length:309 start_codon:yes stop_codon:yes gene_type:complete